MIQIAKSRYMFLILSLLFFTSCIQSVYYLSKGSSVFPPTDADSIKIYAGDIEVEYVVIGSIAVDSGRGFNTSQRLLKQEAAKIGADAIIHVELRLRTSQWSNTGMSGVAIKFK